MCHVSVPCHHLRVSPARCCSMSSEGHTSHSFSSWVLTQCQECLQVLELGSTGEAVHSFGVRSGMGEAGSTK